VASRRSRSCRIRRSSGYYYVEYRRPLGFDAKVSGNANIANGVLMHLASPSNSNSSYLLDMTPGTTSWSEPALVAGQSYYDASTGLTLMPAWVSGTDAGVNISFGPIQYVKSARGDT
jgi:hypothetical protein